jgi:hypothetical protein
MLEPRGTEEHAMSDDPRASGAGDSEEDAFSRAFRERRATLTGSTTPPVRPDPTSPLPMTDAARMAVHPPPAEPAERQTRPPSDAAPPDPYAARPEVGTPPGQPYPAYGSDAPRLSPPQGQPYPTYGHQVEDQSRPSAAPLVTVSLLTMVFTMLFVGLPSVAIGLLAVGKDDAAAKRRLLRVGWIVYVVNWAFVVIGAVLLGVGLAVWMHQLTTPVR